MPYGIQVRDEFDNLRFDSTYAKGGIVIEQYMIDGTTSGSVSYPEYAGRSAVVNFIQASGAGSDVVIDYALGYPRATWSAVYTSRIFQIILI